MNKDTKNYFFDEDYEKGKKKILSKGNQYGQAIDLFRFIKSHYDTDVYKTTRGKEENLNEIKNRLLDVLELDKGNNSAEHFLKVIEHTFIFERKLANSRRIIFFHTKDIFENFKNFLQKKPPGIEKANEIYQDYIDSNIAKDDKLNKDYQNPLKSKIINFEVLGHLYFSVLSNNEYPILPLQDHPLKDTILFKEGVKNFQSAFNLCKRDPASNRHTLARYYLWGIGTDKSIIKGLNEYFLLFEEIPDDKNKLSRSDVIAKSRVAEEISNIYFEPKFGLENFEESKNWLLKAHKLLLLNHSCGRFEHDDFCGVNNYKKRLKSLEEKILNTKSVKKEIPYQQKSATFFDPSSITLKNLNSVKGWYPGFGFYEYPFSEKELDFIKNITKVILDSNRSGLFRTKQPIFILEYIKKFYKIVKEERSEIGLNFLNKLERPFLDYLYPDIFIQLGFQTNGKRDIFGTISY